jgi:hypothetical protein
VSTTKQADDMGRLAPEERALLELSSKQGVSDQEIADLLRLDAEEVAERRRRAELRLKLEEKPAAEPRRSRTPLVAGVLILGAVVAVAAIVLASGGDDEARETARRGEPTQGQKSAAASAGPVRAMERLNGTYARGTAQLLRSGGSARLRLRLSEFRPPQGGGYAVWLTGSQGDGRWLYATASTTINTDLRLRRDYRRYRYLEVVRAVPELRSDHSGLTLLRLPVAELAG